MDDEQKKNIRSTAYPSIPLEDAIRDLEKVRKNLGKGSYNRESIAHSMGYSGLNGAAVRKVAALVHFGLLERSGNTYKYSSLADRILFPVENKDKKQAIVESALYPKLYSSLVERYSGSSIPNMLANILIQQFKINDQVAKSAADDFIKTMEFAGLLKNGVLTNSIEDLENEIESESPYSNNNQNPSEEIVSKERTTKTSYIDLPALPSGIIVSFPVDLAPYASLGNFSDGLKALEEKAKDIRHNNTEGVS